MTQITSTPTNSSTFISASNPHSTFTKVRPPSQSLGSEEVRLISNDDMSIFDDRPSTKPNERDNSVNEKRSAGKN